MLQQHIYVPLVNVFEKRKQDNHVSQLVFF